MQNTINENNLCILVQEELHGVVFRVTIQLLNFYYNYSTPYVRAIIIINGLHVHELQCT